MCVRVDIIRPDIWTVIQLSLVFIKRSASWKCGPDHQSRVDPKMPIATEVQSKSGVFFRSCRALVGSTTFLVHCLHYPDFT